MPLSCTIGTKREASVLVFHIWHTSDWGSHVFASVKYIGSKRLSMIIYKYKTISIKLKRGGDSFFCRFSVVLFDITGISRCLATHCICRVIIFDSCYFLRFICFTMIIHRLVNFVIFTVWTEQLIKCFKPLQKLRARLGTRLTGLSPLPSSNFKILTISRRYFWCVSMLFVLVSVSVLFSSTCVDNI